MAKSVDACRHGHPFSSFTRCVECMPDPERRMDTRWAEALRKLPDRYGRTWDMAPEDRCKECGQPLVEKWGEHGSSWRCIGGLDHERIFDDVAREMGGLLAVLPAAREAVHARERTTPSGCWLSLDIVTVDDKGAPLDPAAEMNGAEGRQMVRVLTSWLSVEEAEALGKGFVRQSDGCEAIVPLVGFENVLKKIAAVFHRRITQ